MQTIAFAWNIFVILLSILLFLLESLRPVFGALLTLPVVFQPISSFTLFPWWGQGVALKFLKRLILFNGKIVSGELRR